MKKNLKKNKMTLIKNYNFINNNKILISTTRKICKLLNLYLINIYKDNYNKKKILFKKELILLIILKKI